MYQWAGQAIEALQKAQEIMVRIFKFFKYSANRLNDLKNLKKILCEHVKRFKKPTAVRWLSLHDAVIAAHDSWGCLVMTHDHEVAANEGDTTLVEALYKDVKTYKFISTLCSLRDVLEPLMKCSKVFQGDIIDVEDTNTMLAATMDSIATLSEHPGTHLSDFHDSLDNDHEFKGIKFTATAHQKR